MNPNELLNGFVKLKDWAKKTGIAYSNALYYVRTGKIKAHKIDRTWFIAKDTEPPKMEWLKITSPKIEGYYTLSQVARIKNMTRERAKQIVRESKIQLWKLPNKANNRVNMFVAEVDLDRINRKVPK